MSEPVVHDYKKTSERLGGVVSAEWLSKHKSELPHCQFGTKVGFSDANIAEIVQMFTVRPGQTAKPVEQVTPLPAPAPQPLQDLKPRGSRRKTA